MRLESVNHIMKRRPEGLQIEEQDGLGRIPLKAPRFYISFVARSHVRVILGTLGPDAAGKLLFETPLSSAREARVHGILGDVEGENCRVAETGAFAE